jgi:hypothetical protein
MQLMCIVMYGSQLETLDRSGAVITISLVAYFSNTIFVKVKEVMKKGAESGVAQAKRA